MKHLFLVILITLAGVTGIWGQDPFSDLTLDRTFYTSLLGDEAGTILDFLGEEQLLDQINIRQLAPTGSFVSVLDGIKQWQSDQLLSGLRPSTQLSLDYYQLSKDTFHRQDMPQQYLNMRLTQAVQIGKLPLSVSGDIILRDGQLDTRFTTGSLQLDHRKALEQLKDKLYGGLELQQLLTAPTNPLQLSPDAQQYLLNELRYRFFQQIITRQDFYQLKSRLLAQADSLAQVGTDQLHQPESAAIAAKLKTIHKIESLYQRYWRGKQNHGQSAINELEEKANEFASQLIAYRNPKALKEALLRQADLRAGEKWLLWSKDLTIGQYQLQGSRFTVRNLALNGIHYAGAGRQWFGTVAWGQQSFNTNFFPTFSTKLLERFSGNRHLYSSVGVGQLDGNHLRISLLNVREGSSPRDTQFVYPKSNTVISLSGATRIQKNWSSELELAISDHDLIGTNLADTGTPRSQPETSAAEISFNYHPAGRWFSIGAGYFYVGSRFISLGNPFLLTNRQGVVTKLRTDIGEQLTINIEGKFGRSIGDDILFEGQLSDIQLVGSLNWQLGPQSQLQAQFSPNTFKQSGAGTFNVSNYNTLVSIQGIFLHPIAEAQLSNLIGYTNYRSNFTYYDTSSLDRSHYLFLQSALSLPSSFQLGATATLGGPKLWNGSIEEIFTQGSLGYRAGKWNASLGLQLLKDRFFPNWQYGLQGALQFNIGKHLRWGADVMWQRGIGQKPVRSRFLGHGRLGVVF